MTYETAIEMYEEGVLTYEEAKKEMQIHCSEVIEICPFDITEQEIERWKRARGLLEEIRFIKQYKD